MEGIGKEDAVVKRERVEKGGGFVEGFKVVGGGDRDELVDFGDIFIDIGEVVFDSEGDIDTRQAVVQGTNGR